MSPAVSIVSFSVESGRQGDAGSAQVLMSAEDELLKRFVPGPIRTRLSAAIRSHTPGAAQLAKKALALAQREAQRMAFRQRKNVLKMDDWLEQALSFTGSTLRI